MASTTDARANSSSTLLAAALLLSLLGTARAQDAPASAPPQDAAPAPAPATAARTGGWRLADSASPYLRLHAGDPVEWYPWGPEAFARAKELARPVFLSIGYSSCHWCHRMQRDTFQDAECARLLDEQFVCIKVDREQRPDVDDRYQQALQLIAGRNGWPATLFLTPDGAPFAGGTYFAPHDTPEARGLLSLAGEVARLWKEQREQVRKSAGELHDFLQQDQLPVAMEWQPSEVLAESTTALAASLDSTLGGTFGAPKFPPCLVLQFLMRQHLRTGVEVLGLVRTSLDAMEAGALHDHVGGGFHRYCVDEKWELPHFEKLLGDNALLAQTYAEAFAITGEPRYADDARSTLQWMIQDLRLPGGLFCAALDADSLPYDHDGLALPDSHPEEGLCYLWSPAELNAALGETDGPAFARLFNVTEAGNVGAGRSILRPMRTVAQLASDPGPGVPSGADFAPWLASCRARLATTRASRPQPLRDEKCLAEWNGLALTALARTAALLGDKELLGYGARLAAAIDQELLIESDGGPGADQKVTLQHQWYDGAASGEGNLSDYACVGRGLLDAYSAIDAPTLLVSSLRTARALLERFEDKEHGGFFETTGGDPLLPGRGRELQDGALPAGASVAIELLLRLAPLDDSGTFATAARRALERLGPLAGKVPAALPALLVDVDLSVGPLAVVVIDGRGTAQAALIAAAGRVLLPGELLITNATSASLSCASVFGGKPALLAERQVTMAEQLHARAWVRTKDEWLGPASSPEELTALLASTLKR